MVTGGRLQTRNNVVESERAVVAADDGRCSEIGASVLRIGGHAVDAAVATALCLGVVYPGSSGIGGGAFMLVKSSSSSSSSSRIEAFDMRETAPLAASKDMYANNGDSKYTGAVSMGVPGELAGLHVAWLKHGRLPWTTLFQPAIKLARHGFTISPYLASHIAKKRDVIMNDSGLRQVYAPDGKLLREGDECLNVALSNTLEAFAEKGAGALYGGVVGEKLVEDVRKAGGILTMNDLRKYRVKITEPVVFDAMGYTVFGMPPPSSGTLGLSLVFFFFYLLFCLVTYVDSNNFLTYICIWESYIDSQSLGRFPQFCWCKRSSGSASYDRSVETHVWGADEPW
ncbi:unnamed protein product [Cuscuta campestris]|uniref:Gamma-glutamyltransferase n=1 Tax=Cuscuta campestris TaxID=132261 RepID=A0A484MG81_9ASTE|nr:unnamed protein product [Cuscuta campestris]